jgi:predicted TIM-barrel fold metal-dependent hydrolase
MVVSRIVDEWCAGRGLENMLVIDGHVHLGEWPTHETFRRAEEVPEAAGAYMDAHGVDAVCAVSGGYMWSGTDYRIGNDRLLAWWRALPDRIIPFYHINPNDTRQGVKAELERMHGEGMRAIKLLNAYQEEYPGDGPNLMLVYEFAAEHNVLVFNHHWTAQELWRISALFPEVVFIGAHGAPVDVLRSRPNVYANIWGYGCMGWIDRWFAEAGTAKYMLGSDAFMNPLSAGIGLVIHAPISDEERRNVLGLTVARLLEGVGILPEPLRKWL